MVKTSSKSGLELVENPYLHLYNNKYYFVSLFVDLH